MGFYLNKEQKTMNFQLSTFCNIALLSCSILLIDAAPPRGKFSKRDFRRAQKSLNNPAHLSGPDWHSKYTNVPAGLIVTNSPGGTPVRYRASKRSQIEANF